MTALAMEAIDWGDRRMKYFFKNNKAIDLKNLTIALPIVLLILFPFEVSSREINLKESAFKSADVSRIQISAYRAAVKVIATDSPQVLVRARKIIPEKEVGPSGDAWNLVSSLESGTLNIEAKGPPEKSIWSESQPVVPEFTIEIEVGRQPLEVTLREGSLLTSKGKNDFKIVFVDGEIKMSKNEGEVKIQGVKGNIQIEDQKGRVEIEQQQGKVGIQGLEGDLVVKNFSGDSNISQVHGAIRVVSRLGNVQVLKSSGGVDFDLGKGALSVSAFQGSLRGKTDDGGVSAQIESEPDVQIETIHGNVSIKLKSTAGVGLKLQTEEGTMWSPAPLNKPVHLGIKKVITGKLNGLGKGSISVRTKDGAIRVQ